MQAWRQHRQIVCATSDSKGQATRLSPGRPTLEVSQSDSDKESEVLVVGWQSEDDPLNPRNWSNVKRIGVTFQVAAIGLVVCAAGAVDAAVLPQAAAELSVSEVAETLATGMFLIGFGVGCLITGPFSEIFGRFAVYTGSLTIFAIWIMAAALAPNFGAQLVFRTLAGLSASTPLTCVGGTISDLYNSLEKTWAFPLYAVGGFGGPLTGLVMVSYVGPTIGWRWAEWVSLLATGVVLALVVLFMPETFAPILLEWKAKHLRKTTGDERHRSPHEMAHITPAARLKIAMTRPFLMATEPIIMLWTLYLSIIYIILFTFLDGYPYIYQETYGISQGLTNVIFVAMDAGVVSILVVVPFVYRHTAHKVKTKQSTPEVRLWYAMVTAPTIPISLFWMGWTARPSISIWSPIIASFLFGYGTTGVFISTYMYIIDSYEMYSASALTFVAVVRYIAAGGMTVAGLPIYEGLGVAYTCTILACASAVMVPVPYVLYRYGHHVRSKSKFAVSSEHESDSA